MARKSHARRTKKRRLKVQQRQASKTIGPHRPAGTNRRTKTDLIIGMLQRRNGASIPEMADAAGWKPNSVRGFLSGTIVSKRGLKLDNELTKGGVRRYFLRRPT